MKPKIIIIISVVFGFLALSYIAVRSWINRIKFGLKVKNLKINKIGWQNINITLPLWMYNPSPFDIVIKNVNLNVYIDGTYLATLSTTQGYMIKSKVASEHPIAINIPTNQLLDILKDKGAMIEDPNWMEKVSISLDGSIGLEAGLINIPKWKIHFDDTLQSWME
jgi:LEA14-like dessication related protein